VLFKNKDIFLLRGLEKKINRRKMQIIFQDPFTSLNPRKTIRSILCEPFLVQRIDKGKGLERRIKHLLEITNMSANILNKYPHELDGGKRQTIGIARALALEPEFIVCDEPISSLDVSIQAQIINLLMDLQENLNLTYLFIAHDLSVVRHISARIVVMYLGKIVEIAKTEDLFNKPLHPYTIALLSAIPSFEINNKRERIILTGDVPSPINMRPICRFYPRCWKAHNDCNKIDPKLELVEQEHWVACPYYK
jgi:oligopeptide/dipeptide ABC transporter ATP-binding protein